MSEDNSQAIKEQTMGQGLGMTDAFELAGGEVPIMASIYHGAQALTSLGEAGIDSALGDDKGAHDHMKDAGVEGFKAIPGMGIAADMGGDAKLRARLYGDAVPESQIKNLDDMKAKNAEDDVRAKAIDARLDAQDAYDMKNDPRNAPAPKTTADEYRDADIIDKHNMAAYDQECKKWDPNAKPGESSMSCPAQYPNLGDEIGEAHTTEGWAKARGYQMLDMVKDTHLVPALM